MISLSYQHFGAVAARFLAVAAETLTNAPIQSVIGFEAPDNRLDGEYSDST
jgi:hypothetical protein